MSKIHVFSKKKVIFWNIGYIGYIDVYTHIYVYCIQFIFTLGEMGGGTGYMTSMYTYFKQEKIYNDILPGKSKTHPRASFMCVKCYLPK